MNSRLKNFLATHSVPLVFLTLSAIAVPISGYSAGYLVQELITRVARNSFLVLSLLIPIMAGMGLNFGMVLGAMAGQIGLIFVMDWSVVGIPGLVLAAIIALPIALLLGFICGSVLNRAKGREMVTSYILGFFTNGVYQFVVLYMMGPVLTITSPRLLLSRGYGVRNAVALDGIRMELDRALELSFQFAGTTIRVPMLTLLLIAAFSLFVVWFRRTKLGQDMRAIGQDMGCANSAGIPVERTRIVAMMVSTVLAALGQIIFLQNMGTMNTYNSHDQIGMFSIAALLIGGASVSKATISNVFVGVMLFHLMFVVSPAAGKELIGQAQIGEFFRVFVSYGIIAAALMLHAWRRNRERRQERKEAAS